MTRSKVKYQKSGIVSRCNIICFLIQKYEGKLLHLKSKYYVLKNSTSRRHVVPDVYGLPTDISARLSGLYFHNVLRHKGDTRLITHRDAKPQSLPMRQIIAKPDTLQIGASVHTALCCYPKCPIEYLLSENIFLTFG